MYELNRTLYFSAAHHLPNHDGPCKNVHGHNYTVYVSIQGQELDEQGMLLDFSELGRIVKETVVEKLDHADLNKTDEKDPTARTLSSNPTAENIAKWIYGCLKPLLESNKYHLAKVKVEETLGSSAAYWEK